MKNMKDKIIISKEEPKDFLGRNETDLLKQEAIEEEMEGFDKQETVEEAAVLKYPKICDASDNCDCNWCIEMHQKRRGFIEGAKWQAERMYSEEDMLNFGEWCENIQKDHKYIRRINSNISRKELFEIWVEQFKKK
jgi:hypothetical protein